MSKWVYRVESKTPNNGLWYDSSQNLVWGIGSVPNCYSKDLPMGYDPKYHKNGKNWHCSVSSLQDLNYWFSIENLIYLSKHGFVLTRYLATEFDEYEHETIFIKSTALARIEIPIMEGLS